MNNNLNIVQTNGELITAEELLEEMDTAGDHAGHDLTVINVLSNKYFDDCRIKDSINLDLDNLENLVEDWDRNRKIVLYSKSYECPLSEEACERLMEMGFTHIRVFEGGIKEWVEMDFPVEGVCMMDYLRD